MTSDCLWPETLIDTAAVRNLSGGRPHTGDMADAALRLCDLPNPQSTGLPSPTPSTGPAALVSK